jgi:hypothetical protein
LASACCRRSWDQADGLPLTTSETAVGVTEPDPDPAVELELEQPDANRTRTPPRTAAVRPLSRGFRAVVVRCMASDLVPLARELLSPILPGSPLACAPGRPYG